MWYLTWLLGTALACTFAIGCGLWYEVHQRKLDGVEPGGVDAPDAAAKPR